MPNREGALSELSGTMPSGNDRHLRDRRRGAGGVIDGEWRTVRAGETAAVPAGVPHTLRNASAEPVRIVNIHRPAQQFESFFRDMHSLIQRGKIKRLPPKEPRSAIYAAMLFGKYPDEIRTTETAELGLQEPSLRRASA